MLKNKFGVFLSIVIFIFFVAILLYFIKLQNEKKPYYIELELNNIKEERVRIKNLPIQILSTNNETFPTLLLKLYKIKDDEKFKLLILNLNDYNLNWEQTYELRKLLKILKKKREIICYADKYSQSAYYLATACSKIYSANGSIVEIPGFYSEILFYKELLDSLNIDIYAVQFEEYKGTLEPLTQREPTKYYIEQREKILNTQYNELLNALKERGISHAESLINIGYFYIKDAIKNKLVDDIKYLDEIKKEIKYKKGNLGKLKENGNKKIVVISAEGTIIDRDLFDPVNRTTTIGKGFAEIIEKIRKDKSVVGVIIRINSPGGSSLISDIISREIKLLSKEKEVVVSMGRVCASGCYYISAYADKIFSEPLTITGSIGVIFAKFSLEDFYRKELYINPYIIKKGKHADIFSLRKLSKEEKEGMKNLVYNIYEDFLNVVSDGRKMNIDSVKKIAKGKIYLGLEAKEIGLVDSIGGFLEALNYLKNKYKDARIEFIEREMELSLDLFGVSTIFKDESFFFIEPSFLFQREIVKP
ncbi:MAG: signal peptide peptidase SppA [candidate division WOR-3 bacterium]|nr:signal peptide peptidase SppA [candidate division WOR-3 bacterium]